MEFPCTGSLCDRMEHRVKTKQTINFSFCSLRVQQLLAHPKQRDLNNIKQTIFNLVCLHHIPQSYFEALNTTSL